MKNILLIVAISLASLHSIAQNTNTNITNMPAMSIKGKIISDEGNLEFATISLISVKQNKTIDGQITPKSGTFNFNITNPGRYIIKAEFLGLKPFTSDTLLVSPRNPNINLNDIKLSENETQTKTVEIVEDKLAVTNTIDKKVFNVDKNLNSMGGSASSVLQNIPGVAVDNDGNVSLRGSQSVRILIDGKPINISDDNRGAYLEQLPANAIESIELITNPSARYDADGMSGIINIVSKKNKLQGLNGSVNANVGNRNKYNAGFNLSYKTKKLNLFTNYSYRYNQVFFRGTSNRANLFSDTTFFINQNTNNEVYNQGHVIKAGLDYSLGAKSTFSLSGGYNSNKGITEGIVNYFYINENKNLTQYSNRIINSVNKNPTSDIALNFKHNFNPSKSISFDASYGRGNSTGNNDYAQFFYDANNNNTNDDIYQTINNIGDFRNMIFQTDYSQKIATKSRFEFGYKATLRDLHSSIYAAEGATPDSKTPNENINNDFNYKDAVYANYINFSTQVNKWGFQAGNRTEFTNINTLQSVGSIKNTQSYIGFFPSAYISYKPKLGYEYQLNYSRRINRPGPQQLNPFADYTDPLNLRQGNPLLKPEFTNSYELAFLTIKEKSNFSITTYFRQTYGIINRIRTLAANGIATVEFRNAKKANYFGADISERYQISKALSLQVNGSIFGISIIGGEALNNASNSALSYNTRGQLSYKIFKGTDFQATYMYNGPSISVQGFIKPIQGLDLGLKREVLKGRGSLSFNVSDVMNKRMFAVESSGPQFEQDFSFKRESRIATLGFTYRFGKAQQGSRQREERNQNQNQGGGDIGF